MADEDEYATPARFEIQVPPELEIGAYANFLSVWHSPYEFTLDFAVTEQVQIDPDAPPLESVTVPTRVVSRIKIPPTLIFDLLQALNTNMTKFEAAYGEIRRPGDNQQQDPAE